MPKITTNIPWLDALSEKINQMPEEELAKYLAKLPPLEEGEVSVGQLTPELLKLWAYKIWEEEAIDRTADGLIALVGGPRSEAMDTAIQELGTRKHELKIIDYMFNRSAFLIASGKTGVSLRQEGKMVELPKKSDEEELTEGLEAILGHGSIFGTSPLISILMGGGRGRR